MTRARISLVALGVLLGLATCIWVRQADIDSFKTQLAEVKTEGAATQRASIAESREHGPVRFLRFEQRKRLRWAIFQLENITSEEAWLSFTLRTFDRNGPTEHPIWFTNPMV